MPEFESELELELELEVESALTVLLCRAFAGGGTRHELVRARVASAQGSAEQAFVRDFWAMVSYCEVGKMSSPAIGACTLAAAFPSNKRISWQILADHANTNCRHTKSEVAQEFSALA